MVAILDVFKAGTVQQAVDVEYWVIAVTGVGIIIGLLLFGERVMATVGTHLTLVTPSRGYCIELGGRADAPACLPACLLLRRIHAYYPSQAPLPQAPSSPHPPHLPPPHTLSSSSPAAPLVGSIAVAHAKLRQ